MTKKINNSFMHNGKAKQATNRECALGPAFYNTGCQSHDD